MEGEATDPGSRRDETTGGLPLLLHRLDAKRRNEIGALKLELPGSS